MALFRSLLAQTTGGSSSGGVGRGYIKSGAAAILDAINNTGGGHGSPTSSWTDLSGNNNDFTISNVTWTSEGCVITPNSSTCVAPQITFGSGQTIEICCSIDENIGGSEKPILADFTGSSGGQGYYCFGLQNATYTSGIGVTLCDANSNFQDYNLIEDSDFVQGKVYTFTVSLDDQGNLCGYIDGVKVFDQATNPTIILPSSHTLQFKAFGKDSYCTLPGTIHSIRLYNKALTQAEVAHNNEVDGKRYKDLIPEEYQRLRYIENSGDAYISTGITIDSINTKVEYKLKVSQPQEYSGQDGFIIGWSSNNTYQGLNLYNDNDVDQWKNYGDEVHLHPFACDIDYEFDLTQYNGTISGTVNGSPLSNNASYVINDSCTLYLFKSYFTGGAYPYRGRLYYCKIYVNDVLTRDFIPCYNKNTGDVGLYDLVTKQQFISSGEDFKFYGIELPSTYQQVEYVESYGSEYLDTGVSCSGGIRCLYSVYQSTGGYVCGAHNVDSPYGRCGANAVNGSWELGYGDNFNSSGIFGTGVRYLVDYQTFYDSAYLKVKGGDYSTLTTLVQDSNQTVSTNNALVFANQYALANSEPLTQAKLYWLRIFDHDNNILADFVPCYEISSNNIGLYDLVSKTFITNLGSGSLGKGKDM